MRDQLIVHPWQVDPYPAAVSVWPVSVGHLQGYGESHYSYLPDYYCPHILVSGSGVVRTPYGEREVTAGDMFTLWPGVSIAYHECPQRPWQYYWVHLIGEGAGAFTKSLGFEREKPVCRPGQPERAMLAFQAMHAYFGASHARETYQAIALLFALASSCQPNFKVDSGARSRALVDEACLLIRSHRHMIINVTELARILRVSRNTLHRAFQDHLGKPPSEIIQQDRMEYAKTLLATSSLSAAAIARECGFANDKYFFRCFRHAVGITPSQWRVQIQEVVSY